MSNAIVVLNARSSSIKFSLFVERGKSLETDDRGQVEGLLYHGAFCVEGALFARSGWHE